MYFSSRVLEEAELDEEDLSLIEENLGIRLQRVRTVNAFISSSLTSGFVEITYHPQICQLLKMKSFASDGP